MCWLLTGAACPVVGRPAPWPGGSFSARVLAALPANCWALPAQARPLMRSASRTGRAVRVALLVLAALAAAPDVAAARMLRGCVGCPGNIQTVQTSSGSSGGNSVASGLGLTSSALAPPTSSSLATGGAITGGQTSGFVPTTSLTGTTAGVQTSNSALATAPPALAALPAGTGSAARAVPAFVPAPAPAPLALGFFNFVPSNPVATAAPAAAASGQLIGAGGNTAGVGFTPTGFVGGTTQPTTAGTSLINGGSISNPYVAANTVQYRG